jgi:hypothetical protein
MKAIEKPQTFINITLLILLAIIALIVIMAGCTSERIEGNHDLVTTERTTQPFSKVSSQGSMNVYIIQDSLTYIEVKAESNILPYIYTRSDGTSLSVGYTEGYAINEHYPVEVYLYTPDLQAINLSGSGTVECNGFISGNMNLLISGSGGISGDFDTETMSASISGSGNMALKGFATNTTFAVSGSGSIDSHALIQEHCAAIISGSGNITTAASKTLDATISGSGNIFYMGNPVITTHITGSGNVIRY